MSYTIGCRDICLRLPKRPPIYGNLKAVGLALAKNEQEKIDVERNFAKLAYDTNVADLDKKNYR